MTTISEAITNIKKAENDADKLIEDAKVKSSEIIEESTSKTSENIEISKEQANSEAEKILFEAETNAKKEAYHINHETGEKVEQTKKLHCTVCTTELLRTPSVTTYAVPPPS